MDSRLLLNLIIGILVLNFVLETFLGYLNVTRWSNTLPASLIGIYDEVKYRQQQQYQRLHFKLGLLSSAFFFITILLMFILGGFGWLDSWLRTYISSPFWVVLAFFGILGLCADLLGIPFQLYDTFVIEQKFGFNTTSISTFFLDKIKGWLLAISLGGGILSLIIYLHDKAGSFFWVLAWIVITIISILVNYLYTVVILPIFNKLTPLEEGELRKAIQAFSEKVNFRISNVFVMDGSKRSKHANAYFSGFGRMKKIVLYDTLIADHPTDELLAILAHEIGHFKRRHILKGLIISIVHTGFLLFVFSLLMDNPVLSNTMGASRPGFHLGVIAFAVLYTPISTVLGIALNALSRRHEFQADAYAADNMPAVALKEALIRLSVKNLSNLTPHPWYVFVHYSHPTLLDRMNALDRIQEGRGS